jgi:hypothetical protein
LAVAKIEGVVIEVTKVGAVVVGNAVPVPDKVYSAATPAPENPAMVDAVPECPEEPQGRLANEAWSVAEL